MITKELLNELVNFAAVMMRAAKMNDPIGVLLPMSTDDNKKILKQWADNINNQFQNLPVTKEQALPTLPNDNASKQAFLDLYIHLAEMKKKIDNKPSTLQGIDDNTIELQFYQKAYTTLATIGFLPKNDEIMGSIDEMRKAISERFPQVKDAVIQAMVLGIRPDPNLVRSPLPNRAAIGEAGGAQAPTYAAARAPAPPATTNIYGAAPAPAKYDSVPLAKPPIANDYGRASPVGQQPPPAIPQAGVYSRLPASSTNTASTSVPNDVRDPPKPTRAVPAANPPPAAAKSRAELRKELEAIHQRGNAPEMARQSATAVKPITAAERRLETAFAERKAANASTSSDKNDDQDQNQSKFKSQRK